LEGLDFFKFMAHAFGMRAESKTKGDFLINFGNFLDGLFKADRRALLIIDEAQNLDAVRLEEIRILSNHERGNNRLNIFFVGQDEFDSVLTDKRLRALKQRITTHYHIEPLSLKETGLYVQYRLKVAGCDRPLFTPSALGKIYGFTNGYPRLINIICDHCLLTAFVEGADRVDPAIVAKSVVDLHPSQMHAEAPSRPNDRSGHAALPPTDGPPNAAHQTSGVTAPTTKQDDHPEPRASLLRTVLRKPVYPLAAAVLILALVWFNFGDAPYVRRYVSGHIPEPDRKGLNTADNDTGQSSASDIPAGAAQVTPAASSPEPPAPPLVVPPTDPPEETAARSMESLYEEPAVARPASDGPPIAANNTAIDENAYEEPEPPSPALSTDQIAEGNEKAAPTEMVSDVSPRSNLPAAGETDAPPLLPEEEDNSGMAAAPPATGSPAEASVSEPEVGRPEFQGTEDDPRAIIDYVIRKRSRQTGDQ
jgi:hypothetical protein